MLNINVQVDMARLRQGLNVLEKDVRKAAVRGLNKGIDAGRTTAAREISAASKIKQKDVRAHLHVRGANDANLSAELSASPYSPNLGKFRASQQKAGVAATAWERRKVYKHAFILPSGRVVTRTTPERFPLKGLRGPSVPSIFKRRDILGRIASVAVARFRTEFERQLRRFAR